MEIEKFINEVEQQGHQWVADEMRLYHENPEMLQSGDMIPEFENMPGPEHLPGMYFYFGVAFGVGMEKTHDL